MDYFSNIGTKEERKKLYYSLSKIHHPDKGGDLKIMQEINRQYSALGVEYNISTDGFDPSYEEVEPTGSMQDLKNSKFKPLYLTPMFKKSR